MCRANINLLPYFMCHRTEEVSLSTQHSTAQAHTLTRHGDKCFCHSISTDRTNMVNIVFGPTLKRDMSYNNNNYVVYSCMILLHKQTAGCRSDTAINKLGSIRECEFAGNRNYFFIRSISLFDCHLLLLRKVGRDEVCIRQYN